MKKIVKMFLILIVLIFSFGVTVYAAEQACKITMNADKSTVKPGDTVTVTLTASDITAAEGIGMFLAEFKYNANIFELIVEENEELKAVSAQIEEMFGFEKSEVIYSGLENITANLNPWYLLCFESEGEKAIFGSPLTAQKDTQEIGKIKFKVKEGVTETADTIELGTIIVYDGLILDDTKKDSAKEYTISGNSVSLTIKPVSNSGGNQQIPQVNNSTNTNKEGTTQNSNTNNKTPTQAPNTGVEDYLPFVFIIITIGTFSYIKYKKYKDIY